MKQTKIGLFGFGHVGQALYSILLETKGIKGEIQKIAIKNPIKKRNLSPDCFTLSESEIINNPNINTIIELIDNPEEAFQIIKKSIEAGKNVVTANKEMLAMHLEELILLQKKHNVSILYEASVCGSIPIIRNLEEYYDNDLLNSITGIFSGSVNYILSKMFNEKSTFEIALQRAEELGFSQKNSTIDIDGKDSLFKLIIIAFHGFGLIIPYENIFHFGINTLQNEDIKFSIEKNKKIKLVSKIYRTLNNQLIMYVIPSLVESKNPLYTVENENNAVIIGASFFDQQILLGKGSGGNPIASAILSDINAITYCYKYEYKKKAQNPSLTYSKEAFLTIYLRFKTKETLKNIIFEEIFEEYYSISHNYIIGLISLEQLFISKEYLIQNNLFIAELN